MKARCNRCTWMDYDVFSKTYEQHPDGHHFCGWHGRAEVDPDGEQPRLSHDDKMCAYSPRQRVVQLELFN